MRSCRGAGVLVVHKGVGGPQELIGEDGVDCDMMASLTQRASWASVSDALVSDPCGLLTLTLLAWAFALPRFGLSSSLIGLDLGLVGDLMGEGGLVFALRFPIKGAQVSRAVSSMGLYLSRPRGSASWLLLTKSSASDKKIDPGMG